MKILNYLPSNVARLIKEAQADDRKRFYIGDLANALKNKYKFLQYPVKIEEFDLRQGIEFVHGIFNDDQIIRKLKVYNNGIFCEAELPTESISKFIDDVFDWVRKDFGIPVEDADMPNQFFMSHMVVESDPSIAQALSKFSTISNKITDLLKSYGQEPPAFEASHIAFHCDTSKIDSVSIRPSMFSFERRTGQPFGEKIYYSSAPLTSEDHLKVLNELEKILAS